jgi:hypothetical protein
VYGYCLCSWVLITDNIEKWEKSDYCKRDV